LIDLLEHYVSPQAAPLAAKWMQELKFDFKVTKKRNTKLGDFRPPFKGKAARISVNGDLGPNHFLITYTHEVAHALVWKKHGRKAKPHGIEWQSAYSELLKEMIAADAFAEELIEILMQHIERPKASSCSDPELYKFLNKFEKGDTIDFLDDLPEGSTFMIAKKRVFIKGKKRRSRFECKELPSNKLYYINGHAEVKLVDTDNALINDQR
jgi:hypothetical protein